MAKLLPMPAGNIIVQEKPAGAGCACPGEYAQAPHDVRLAGPADDAGMRRLLALIHARFLGNAPSAGEAEAARPHRIDLAV